MFQPVLSYLFSVEVIVRMIVNCYVQIEGRIKQFSMSSILTEIALFHNLIASKHSNKTIAILVLIFFFKSINYSLLELCEMFEPMASCDVLTDTSMNTFA